MRFRTIFIHAQRSATPCTRTTHNRVHCCHHLELVSSVRRAFHRCGRLTSVSMPEVTFVREWSFAETGLTSFPFDYDKLNGWKLFPRAPPARGRHHLFLLVRAPLTHYATRHVALLTARICSQPAPWSFYVLPHLMNATAGTFAGTPGCETGAFDFLGEEKAKLVCKNEWYA